MNAEQPLTTPTRFLLECTNATGGYPFPSVAEDPFNRCAPLTPPLPHQSALQHPHQHQHQHVFAAPQPIFTGAASYYPAPAVAPVKQPPTPPPSTYSQPTAIHTEALFSHADPSAMPNPTTTATTNSTHHQQQHQHHPHSHHQHQPAQQEQQHQQLALPPSPTKSTAGRKRRASSEHEDEEEDEQRKKLLERNRVAASKCRQKKKKWMQELEVRSEQVATRNKELHDLLSQLREESMYLRNQLLTHSDCNCTMVQTYLRRSSARLSSGAYGHPTAAAADAVADLMNNNPTTPPSSMSPSSSSQRSSPETF